VSEKAVFCLFDTKGAVTIGTDSGSGSLCSGFDQSFAALASLKSPAREMVLFAILTSMNIAEICGLQWKRVNLNEQFTTVDGESLPPLTIAVRAQWYRGEYGSVKAKSRRRNI